jgi:hypothetical protein
VGNLKAKYTAKWTAEKRRKAAELMAKSSEERLKQKLGDGVLGEIVAVDAESQFVLLRHYRLPAPSVGTVLETRADAGGSRILICPISKSGLIAADIVSGTPNRGDAIYLSKDQPIKVNPFQKYGDGTVLQPVLPGSQEATIALPPLRPVQPPEGNPAVLDAPPAPQLTPELTPEMVPELAPEVAPEIIVPR